MNVMITMLLRAFPLAIALSVLPANLAVAGPTIFIPMDLDDGCPPIPDGCPASLRDRTPDEVFDDLQTAIDAELWDTVACQYDTKAFILDDQGTLVGHQDIILAKQSLNDLFCGINPNIIQTDVFRDTVRILDSMVFGNIEMTDRVRTFTVKCGLITAQTSHGEIVFTGPPSDCPE